MNNNLVSKILKKKLIKKNNFITNKKLFIKFNTSNFNKNINNNLNEIKQIIINNNTNFDKNINNNLNEIKKIIIDANIKTNFEELEDKSFKYYDSLYDFLRIILLLIILVLCVTNNVRHIRY